MVRDSLCYPWSAKTLSPRRYLAGQSDMMASRQDRLMRVRFDPHHFILIQPEKKEHLFVALEVLFRGAYDFLRIGPGDKVLDAGAHIGTFSLLAASKGAEVVAVESEQTAFELLELNSRLATPGRVECSLGFVTGLPRRQNDVTVDDLAIQFGIQFDIIKMDIEGEEANALAAADRTLQMLRELAVEVHSPELSVQVSNTLRQNGLSLRTAESSIAPERAGRVAKLYYRIVRILTYGRAVARFIRLNPKLTLRVAATGFRILIKEQILDRGKPYSLMPEKVSTIHAWRTS